MRAKILPLRLQKSLLRVIEEWKVAPIGETLEKRVNVLCVFASNEPPPFYGLAHDLVARLQVIELPAIESRTADVPAIFLHVLSAALSRVGLNMAEVSSFLCADHFESLCLDGFVQNNTRGLISLAGEIAGEIAAGTTAGAAIEMVFKRRYADGPVFKNRYVPSSSVLVSTGHDDDSVSDAPAFAERRLLSDNIVDQATLDVVKESYYACRGVVVDISAYLKDKHQIHLSRGRISEILDRLALPRVKRRRS
jgi:hypothetical protein